VERTKKRVNCGIREEMMICRSGLNQCIPEGNSRLALLSLYASIHSSGKVRVRDQVCFGDQLKGLEERFKCQMHIPNLLLFLRRPDFPSLNRKIE
jgi:hypothetical protein